ncbi:MAG: TolC family outer membrane protein [Magnetococcales bacterium]|nr:TolC family outer membrane protein [Magnetococcales bacterium]
MNPRHFLTPQRLLFGSFSAKLRQISLLCCMVLPAALAHAESELTPFQQAIQSAIATNPKILAARSNLAATRERYAQALASLLPDAAFNASRSKRSDTWTDTASNQSPSRFNVRLAQPLFSRSLWLAMEQTKPIIAAAEEDYNAALQSVILETIQAMVAVLMTESVERLAENNLILTQRNLEAAQARRQAGDLTQTDVDQATARVASSEAELIRAKNDAMVARARFEESAGIVVPEQLSIPNVPPSLLKGTLQELSASRISRPDLKAAELRTKAADVAIEMERAGHLPTIDLQADAVTYRGGSGVGSAISGENEYSVAVQLSVPIFSGGRTLSKTREALELRASRQAEYQRVEKQALREINQAYLLMRSAKATVASAEAAFQFYHQAVKGMKEEFGAGFRTVIDLLELQNQSFRSETDLVKYRYELVSAQYQLLYTFGRLTPEELRFPGTKDPDTTNDSATDTEEANPFTRFIDALRPPATPVAPTLLQQDSSGQNKKVQSRPARSQPVTSRSLHPAKKLQAHVAERPENLQTSAGQVEAEVVFPDSALGLSLSKRLRFRPGSAD